MAEPAHCDREPKHVTGRMAAAEVAAAPEELTAQGAADETGTGEQHREQLAAPAHCDRLIMIRPQCRGTSIHVTGRMAAAEVAAAQEEVRASSHDCHDSSPRITATRTRQKGAEAQTGAEAEAATTRAGQDTEATTITRAEPVSEGAVLGEVWASSHDCHDSSPKITATRIQQKGNRAKQLREQLTTQCAHGNVPAP